MSRNKHSLPILQHEFGFVPDTFRLMQETADDGERLAREFAQAEEARRAQENQSLKLPGIEKLAQSFTPRRQPCEYKVVALRECPTPENLLLCDTPEKAAEYWRLHIRENPYFNPECECFAVLILNTRRRVKGHHLVSIGTLDTLLVHPREVFRLAIMTSAAAIILMHNHPSGESTPSEADIKVTRDFIRAGQLLKIEVLDHVIVGNPNHSSLRALGYFYS